MKVGTTRGFTACFLLALLFCQFLAACGGSPNPNAPVTLNVWVLPAVPEVSGPPANWDFYNTVRQKLNINLKLTLIPVGDEGNTKLSAAAAANNLPDLFQITPNANNLFLQWVNLGLVSPVDSLFPLMPQRTKARYSNSTLNKLVTFNGKVYALQEPAQLTTRQGIFIRKDWLDKLGLQMPTTLDQLLNVAKAFTYQDPDGDGKNDTYGIGLMTDTNAQPSLGGDFNFIYGAFGLPGAWNFNTHGKVSLSLLDPGYLQGTEFIKQLVDAKVIDPNWTTLKTDDFRARWKQGKYGIIVEDFCSLNCQANYQPFDQNVPNGEYVPLAPPQGPTGQSYVGNYTDVGFRMGVSKQAMDSGKGPAIARLLEWLNSGEGYYLAGYGKAGTNYKLDAQGNITTAGVSVPFTSHAEAPYIQMRNMVLNGSPAELKARYPSFKTQNGRTIDPLQIYQTLKSMSWQDTTRGFAIQPASNEVDIDSYVDQGLIQFTTGQKPLTTASWNAFIQGLNGLNVSDWETAAQKALQDKGLLQ